MLTSVSLLRRLIDEGTVKIERLAACFPLPIKYESRRKHIQRFLNLAFNWLTTIISFLN